MDNAVAITLIICVTIIIVIVFALHKGFYPKSLLFQSINFLCKINMAEKENTDKKIQKSKAKKRTNATNISSKKK